jgi:predicted small lipoprotein YifL
MRRFLNLIVVLVLAGALSTACGRKGPLEKPDDDDQDRQQNLVR